MIRHSVKNAGRCHTIKHQTNAQVIIMAKKTKCFADGGAIGSDGLTDEQRAKKNAALSSLGISSAPAPVPQPQAQNPAPPPKPQQQGIGSGIIGILKGRQQQIDKAAGYANGGIINDELLYAGLNGRGETERNMEWETRHLSPEAKAQYFIERDKVALEASKVRNGYANGGIIRGPGTAKSDSIPATVRETGEEIRVGNGERIVSKEQDAALGHIAQMLGYESVDAMFEKLTGKPVGPTIKGGKRAAADGMSPEEKEWRLKTGNLMSEYPGKPSEYNAAASRMLPPVFPDGFGAKVNPDAPPVGLDKVVSGIAGMFSDAARASNTAETKSYEQLRAERAGTQQQAQPVGKPSDLPGASLSNEDRSVPVPITTAQSPTSQSRQVNNERGIITADTASASMSSPMTRRGGIAGSYDGKGVNDILERENKARAGMIDSMIAANGGNGVGIVGQEAADATARDNAEKTRRWRNDELVSLATRGNQGAIASLINAEGGRGVAEMGNETQRRNAELAAQVANNRDKLTMRGQDLNAQNELARLLGNPLDQQSKQLELKKQGIISGLFDKANSGDQEALAKYNALVNGSKEPNYSNRYITLPNRKTYNDMGQITGEEPGGVFDAKTGQLANFGKQGTGVNIEEANKIKAAVASGAMKREDAIKKLQAMGLQ